MSLSNCLSICWTMSWCCCRRVRGGGEDVVSDVFVNRVGQAVKNDRLEIFSFKDLLEVDSLLFRVHSRSGREGRGDSVV